jgi:heme ABC exporter ATP-binding subunit CcmA
MIHASGLTKSFGDHAALRGVDLDVGRGERLTLVGPNGAGKTTLLRILATLSTPTSGSVQIAGLDLRKRDREIRRRIGFLSHQPLLYDDLTGEENLGFYGHMYDVPNLGGRIREMLLQVGLERSRRDLVRTYSRGMKQRLAIARAFLHDPPLLLLDEPYTGLDQQAAEMLDAVLQGVGMDSRTIVLTTHDLERGLAVGQRMAVLVRGKIAYHMDENDWDPGRFRRAYATETASDGKAA